MPPGAGRLPTSAPATPAFRIAWHADVRNVPLLMLVLVGEWVARIPMAALVAVMIMVSIGTSNWASVRILRRSPRSASAVMIATVVVATHDCARAVLVGVLLSGFFVAHEVGLVRFVGSKSEYEERVQAPSTPWS